MSTENVNEAVVSARDELPKEIEQPQGYVRFDVPDPVVRVNNINLYYGKKQALKNIYMDIAKNKATAFIGPSGCGKSTLLRCFNRLNDLIDEARVEGEIRIDGINIYDADIDITDLRKNVGMVFQKSNPFPKSIYENVAYGAKIASTLR